VVKTLVLATALIVVGAVGVSSMKQPRPDRVSGTLTRTYTIVADTELVGDVTCAVADATPCFSFSVPGVELRLNGFTATGKGDPVTGCAGTPTTGEVGVSTNGQSQVTVRGPGLIQRFRGHGVQVTGSTNARVEGLTVSTNCGSGIFILASSFSTLVEGNTSLRNGSSVAGAACGGI
jgi:Periplasmic copper-binding protein (NosD)